MDGHGADREDTVDSSRGLTLRERAISGALRSLPLKHGKHRLLDRLAPRSPSAGPARVRMGYAGADLIMDVDDLVGWHSAVLRSFDPEVSEVLGVVASTSPRTVLWDVGANKGACSYAVAAAFPDAELVLIEPQPAMQPLLEHNVAALAPGRSELWPVALGREDGRMTLHIPEENKGRASLVHQGEGQSVEIDVITPRAAEGAVRLRPAHPGEDRRRGLEVDVVTALESFLSDQVCEALVFENHQEDAAAFEQLRGIFQRHGYLVHGITRTPFSTHLTPTDTLLDHAIDYVALRPDAASRPVVKALIRAV